MQPRIPWKTVICPTISRMNSAIADWGTTQCVGFENVSPRADSIRIQSLMNLELSIGGDRCQLETAVARREGQVVNRPLVIGDSGHPLPSLSTVLLLADVFLPDLDSRIVRTCGQNLAELGIGPAHLDDGGIMGLPRVADIPFASRIVSVKDLDSGIGRTGGNSTAVKVVRNVVHQLLVSSVEWFHC